MRAPAPMTVAALRGLILAVLLAAIELATAEGDLTWRTVVIAVAGALLRWLGEGAIDRHDGPQANILGVNRDAA